jgi:hypothetical protein
MSSAMLCCLSAQAPYFVRPVSHFQEILRLTPVDTYTAFPTDLTGIRSLYFELDGSMTDAGGIIDIVGYDSPRFGQNIVDGFCEDPDCEFYDASQPGRGPDFQSGTPQVVGTPINVVPLPAGAILLLSALGAAGLMRRKIGG